MHLAQQEPGAAESALMHRDAVYLALDLGDAACAMTHALSGLELARACQDGPLQVKAHVALALVQAESYDDLGAQAQFAVADQLAREHHDDRGVALIAVNTSHYDLERRNYGNAVALLSQLLRSEHVRGLALPESKESAGDLSHQLRGRGRRGAPECPGRRRPGSRRRPSSCGARRRFSRHGA